MISKHRKLSWILITVFIFSMVLPGFVQPIQAVDPISPSSITINGVPADGAVEIPDGVPLLATFPETVTLKLGYENLVWIQYSADGVNYSEPLSAFSVVPVQDAQQNFTNQISIAPTTGNNWGANLFYRVTIDAGAIVGLTSEAINTSFTVNFKTVDTISPEILDNTQTNPQDGDINVPLTTSLTANYSEAVVVGPHYMMISMVADPLSANPVPQQISTSIEGNVLSITPVTALAPNTTYKVTIPVGAAQDAAGNLQLSSRTFTFTTVSSVSGGGGSPAVMNFFGSDDSTPAGGCVAHNATGPKEEFFNTYYAYRYLDGRKSFNPADFYAGTGTEITGFDSLSNPAASYVFDFSGYQLIENPIYIKDQAAEDYGHEYRAYDGSNAVWTMYDISGASPIVVATGTMDDLKMDISYDLRNSGANPSICGKSRITVSPAGEGSFYEELMAELGTDQMEFIYNSTTPPIIAENSDADLADQYAYFDFDITLFPFVSPDTSTISGTVTASNGGAALAGITMIAMNQNDFSEKIYGTTDENGYYSIPVSPGSQYYVIAFPRDGNQPYANSFYSATAGGSIPVDNATVVAPDTSNVNFTLIAGGSISGTINDASGKPISDISVKCQRTDVVNGWYDWATTDGAGNYNVAGLPYGTYTVSAPDAPNATNKTNEDNFWQQAQLNDIVIDTTGPNKTAVKLTLNPVGHPVVAGIWPAWIAAGTTEAWIDLNGAGFNTLGENPSLKIIVDGVTVAQSDEINIGSDGRWLSAKVQSIAATGLTPTGLYNGSILLNDNNTNIQYVCDNWIGITSEPFISGKVDPWAISGKGINSLRLYGANLNQLGTAQIQVYMANKENPQQAYFGTAQVGETDDGSQYLAASFNFGTVNAAPGYYYLAANNPPVTIHGMVDEATVTDTCASVEVVDFPALTNVILQQNNTLLVEGVNFNQFADMSKVKAVITLQGDSQIQFDQSVTRISATQLQVDLPANITAENHYDLNLYDNWGTETEQWIPQTWWFYLPLSDSAQAQFDTTDEIAVNEIYNQGNWGSEAFQLPISYTVYTDPVNQLEAEIRGEYLPDPIVLPLSLNEGQLGLNVPSGLLQVGYYEVVLLDKQTRREYDRRNVFVDNQTVPFLWKIHQKSYKSGSQSIKVQFDGSTAIRNYTDYTVKLINPTDQTVEATASEVNWDTYTGRYIEAVFTGAIATGEYKLAMQYVTQTGPLPALFLNGSDTIYVTDQPFVYNNVTPWAVTGQDQFTVKLTGQNLTGLQGLTLYLCDDNDDIVLTSASASITAGKDEDYITASFNPAAAHLSEGWYKFKSNQTTEITCLKDLYLNVSSKPKVTGGHIEESNQLIINGINLSKTFNADNTDNLNAQIFRDGILLAEVAVANPATDITDYTITIPLTMAQLQNQLNGYYQVWLFANLKDQTQMWFDRSADFKIGNDIVWAGMEPGQINPNYSATDITVTQQSQLAWKANDLLTIRLFRMGETTAVSGFDNLSPKPGTNVTDTSFTFTLPAGLSQGIYWAEITKNNMLIAKSRLQIGGPWITNNTLQTGYSATTMTVNQEALAFWQANNALTLSIMKSTATGAATPVGTQIYVPGSSVTATSFSFMLPAGLSQGNYFVQIMEGSEVLTGAPFGVVAATPSVPLAFTDNDADHVYFNDNHISFEITLSELSGVPNTTLEITSGVWTDATNFVTSVPSLKNVSANLQNGKLVVSGQINNPDNTTLQPGCLGINVIIPEAYRSYMGGKSNIGPFGIISSTATKAIVGVQIPLPEGIVSDPIITSIPNLANVSNLKFTKTGFGSIQFTNPIDLYHNFEQAKNMPGGINVNYNAADKKYHVAVDTATMTFLAGKAARIEIFNVPFTSTANLVITTNTPGGTYSNVVLDTANKKLTFDVNHFSEYTVYEAVPTVNKTLLNTAIGQANTLLTQHSVGTANGNVPADAYSAFENTILKAADVFSDPDATQTEIDDQISALATATTAFNNAIIMIIQRDFSIGSVQLFNGLGDLITTVGAQGGYRIKAQIINNTAAAKNALVIIQVRNGSGATATGGGKVLGLSGVETAIPTTGGNISCSFTLPSGLSGTAYVDVFVWDGWDSQGPLADPYQKLTFAIQ